MKVFSLIASVLASEWDGVSVDNSCGMTIQTGENFVNKTCTVAGSSIEYIFAGNGAFINGDKTFTGVDGVSGEVDLVVFFSQSEDLEGNLDNSTCWDAAVTCEDTGADYSVMFMESVNDHRNAKNGNYNLQIANAKEGDTLSFQLNDNDGNGYAVQNITAPFGTVNADEDAWGNFYSDDGAFSVTVGDEVFGQLFQLFVVQQPGNTGVLSLWSSTVSN